MEGKMDTNVENSGEGKGKKKSQISCTGICVGGWVLVVGSALVIGGLMAAFVINRSRRRAFNNSTTTTNAASQDENQGPSSLLQPSSPTALGSSSWTDKEDNDDEMESVVQSDNEDSNTIALGPDAIIEDTMPELEEAGQPERSGEEEHRAVHIENKEFNGEDVFSNDATEVSMRADEMTSNIWLRIISMLVVVLFLLLIYPIPRYALSAVLSLLSSKNRHE